MSNAINEMRGRLEAATPGPWAQGHGVSPHIAKRDWVEVTNQATICHDVRPADAEFIAHAPEDVTHLLDAVEMVLAQCDSYKYPSKQDDPTGEIGSALEAFEATIRAAIENEVGR